MYGATPGVTLSTTVPLTVSAVLAGLLPIASAASFTVRSSFDAASPESDSVIVSVTVEVSPSPSVIVYTNVSVAPAGGTTFGAPS